MDMTGEHQIKASKALVWAALNDPEVFAFSGNRAILLDPDRPLPEAELRHCIALALTYHSKGTKRYL